MVFTPQSSAASSGQTFRVNRVNARNGNDFSIQSRFVFGRPKSPNTLYSNNENHQTDRSAACHGVSLVWWNESESSPSQAGTGRNEALKVIAVVSRGGVARSYGGRDFSPAQTHLLQPLYPQKYIPAHLIVSGGEKKTMRSIVIQLIPLNGIICTQKEIQSVSAVRAQSKYSDPGYRNWICMNSSNMLNLFWIFNEI